MAEFYDHPKTGRMHFRAVAGGHGGGATSEWDAPACEHDIAAHPREMAAYMKAKRKAKEEADKAEAVAAEVAEIEKSAEAITATTESPTQP